MKDKLTKSTLIPLGVAVAVMVFLGVLIWKTSAWTTQTDNRLVAIENRLTGIEEAIIKSNTNSLQISYETEPKEL